MKINIFDLDNIFFFYKNADIFTDEKKLRIQT